MKKIYTILTLLLLTASVFLTQQATAQAPQKMSYQSVIRNSSNALLVNTAVGIKISVLQGTASGTAVYVETQSATTNANGLMSLQIGTGASPTGTFAGIDWAAGPYFIKTETDPAGGTNYTITGTQEMLSVPYAMYAAKSGDATTMGTIGGSSSTYGGTITAGVLRLTPADATNGGVVTTGAQTFAGNKALTGKLGVGTSTPAETAQLDVSSTTKGFLPPRMTSLQRNAIPTTPSDAGLTIWCSNCGTVGELQVFNGSAWTNAIGGATTPVLAVGVPYQGGIVAYILAPGDPGYDANIMHGLIVANSDQISNGWGGDHGEADFLSSSGAMGTAIGTGLSNTNSIITHNNIVARYILRPIAAGVARQYTGGGYTDWYLPSKDELAKLYAMKQRGFGDFTSSSYWSSTEYIRDMVANPDDMEYGYAWIQDFVTGNQEEAFKYFPRYVRAVRAF